MSDPASTSYPKGKPYKPPPELEPANDAPPPAPAPRKQPAPEPSPAGSRQSTANSPATANSPSTDGRFWPGFMVLAICNVAAVAIIGFLVVHQVTRALRQLEKQPVASQADNRPAPRPEPKADEPPAKEPRPSAKTSDSAITKPVQPPEEKATPPAAATEKSPAAGTEPAAQPPVPPVPATPAESKPPAPADPKAVTAMTPAPEVNRSLQLVGELTAAHLYQTFLNIGLLADAAEEDIYTAADSRKMLATLLALTERMDQQLGKLAETNLDAEDLKAVARTRQLNGLLRTLGTELGAYWETPEANREVKKDHEMKFHKARQEAWTGIKEMLDIKE